MTHVKLSRRLLAKVGSFSFGDFFLQRIIFLLQFADVVGQQLHRPRGGDMILSILGGWKKICYFTGLSPWLITRGSSIVSGDVTLQHLHFGHIFQDGLHKLFEVVFVLVLTEQHGTNDSKSIELKSHSKLTHRSVMHGCQQNHFTLK